MSNKEVIHNLKAIRELGGAGNPQPEWLAANRDILLMQVKNSIRARASAPRVLSMQTVWQFLDVFLPARTVYFVVRPSLAIVLVIGLMFGGWVATVSASYNSLPGEYLYSVKIATEAVQVAVSPKPLEAQLHAEFAVRRAHEVAQLVAASSPTPEKVKTVQGVVNNLQKELASAKGGLGDLKNTGSSTEVAQAAKVVGEKAVEVQQVLDQTSSKVGSTIVPIVLVTPVSATSSPATLQSASSSLANTATTAPQPTQESNALQATINSASSAADDTSTSAIQVLVDTHKADNQSVSSADVKSVVNQKIQSIELKVNNVDAQLNTITATSTVSVIAPPSLKQDQQILDKTVGKAVDKTVGSVLKDTAAAKTTLDQAKQLTNTQNFDQALNKIQQVQQIVNTAQTQANQIQTTGTTSTVSGVGVVDIKAEVKGDAQSAAPASFGAGTSVKGGASQ